MLFLSPLPQVPCMYTHTAKDLQEGLISQSGATAQNRFTLGYSHNKSQHRVRMTCLSSRGEGEKGIIYLLLSLTSVQYLRDFLRKSSFVYNSSTLHTHTHTHTTVNLSLYIRETSSRYVVYANQRFRKRKRFTSIVDA